MLDVSGGGARDCPMHCSCGAHKMHDLVCTAILAGAAETERLGKAYGRIQLVATLQAHELSGRGSAIAMLRSTTLAHLGGMPEQGDVCS